MPTFNVRNQSEVPAPNRAPKAIRETQEMYESFIRDINGNVGELDLAPEENIRGVKVRLRRAATRLGADLQVWDHAGNVYFKTATKRGRPRKAG